MADGRWASLQSCLPLGISQSDARAMLLHIAQTLTLTEESVAMPFYLKVGNIPSSMDLYMWSGVGRPPTSDDWFFSMAFGPRPSDPGFSLRVTPVDSTYAAAQPRMPACKVVDGLQVCVASGQLGEPLSGALARLGYTGLLDDIVVLGANPATWTTNVFR